MGEYVSVVTTKEINDLWAKGAKFCLVCGYPTKDVISDSGRCFCLRCRSALYVTSLTPALWRPGTRFCPECGEHCSNPLDPDFSHSLTCSHHINNRTFMADESRTKEISCPYCYVPVNVDNKSRGSSNCYKCSTSFSYDRKGGYISARDTTEVECPYCLELCRVRNKEGFHTCTKCSEILYLGIGGSTNKGKEIVSPCPDCGGLVPLQGIKDLNKVTCPHCLEIHKYSKTTNKLVVSTRSVMCPKCNDWQQVKKNTNQFECRMCASQLYSFVGGFVRTGETLRDDYGWKMCRRCKRYTEGSFSREEKCICMWCGGANRLSVNKSLYKWKEENKTHKPKVEDKKLDCPVCGAEWNVDQYNYEFPPGSKSRDLICLRCSSQLRQDRYGLNVIHRGKKMEQKETDTMPEKTLVKKTVDKALKHGTRGVKLSAATNVARMVDAKVMRYMGDHIPDALKNTETGAAIRLFLIPLLLSTLADSAYGDVIPSKDKVIKVCGLAMEGSAKEATDALSIAFLPMLEELIQIDVPDISDSPK